MSSFLYHLSHFCFRARKLVILIWLLVLIAVGVLTATLGGKFNDSFEIPGASSQIALNQLKMSFPQAALVNADLIVSLPNGETVQDTEIKKKVKAGIANFSKLPFVDSAIDPWSSPISNLISTDQQAVLIKLLLKPQATEITEQMRIALVAETEKLAKALPHAKVKIGGTAFSAQMPKITIIEVIGILVAILVLLITFRSIVAAIVPLLIALTGAGLSVMLLLLGTKLIIINSTTLMLALMLALAVGIDYSLFILARYRDHLTHGLNPDKAAARSVGTSGSAVVFAGTTVVVALVGLFISRIPFLTTMGMFAAGAVAIEVLLAITLLPALLGFLGEKIRPKTSRRTKNLNPRISIFTRLATWWVKQVTKYPIIVSIVVLVGLGSIAIPARSLSLALPNSGQHGVENLDRQTYDLISSKFGTGYNGILIVTANIVESTDPLGLAKNIRKDIEKLPGVATVIISTPNQNADTLMVQVVPTTAPDDPATNKVVNLLRAQAANWEKHYHIRTAVTGYTAMAIDVSNRLAGALLPFTLFVVGISLILLTVVFRSLWVPLKAALGYLLSIGAAFGATALVFNFGIGKSLINLPETIPVISFLPIIVMGIIFGLAMDYEVFLVSRMREEYVHGNRNHWVQTGFIHSSKVVVAAALIMFAVFAFFVPASQGPVKPIAFALAVGVAIDAFLVRMTLVPAVIQLLGNRVWQISPPLEKLLPVLDIEGKALNHMLALANWPSANHEYVVYTENLGLNKQYSRLPSRQAGGKYSFLHFSQLNIHAKAGDIIILRGNRESRRAALLALAGRFAFDEGKVKVADFIYPEQRGQARRHLPCLLSPNKRQLQKLFRKRYPVVLLDWPLIIPNNELQQLTLQLVAERNERVLIFGCPLGMNLDKIITEKINQLGYSEHISITVLEVDNTSITT